jgi:hypothetical protein
MGASVQPAGNSGQANQSFVGSFYI